MKDGVRKLASTITWVAISCAVSLSIIILATTRDILLTLITFWLMLITNSYSNVDGYMRGYEHGKYGGHYENPWC